MEPTIIRRAVAVGAATGVALLGALAPTASAVPSDVKASGWHCNSSSKSIDNPGYWGPWADNLDFTAKVCAQRIGSTVYTETRLSWSTPSTYQSNPLHDAYGREYVKHSTSGPDPVTCARTTDRIQQVIGKSGSSGTLTSKGKSCPTVKYGLGDFALRLDWKDDGAGDKTYKFSASPRV